MFYIGIDLGGTKTEIIALDKTGRPIFSKRVDSPRDDYDATLNNIVDLVQECEHTLGEKGLVGIGAPGSISTKHPVLKNSNSTWLNGHPLHIDLQNRLNRDIRIANDANCFVLSEAYDGAAAGHGIVFGVILGTGTGGGIVIDKKLVSGPNGISGEWGHNPLPWKTNDETPGPPCYCGKNGCIETFLSGPGMATIFQATCGEKRSPQEIVERAMKQNAVAEAAMDDYFERLAKSLAHVINILDPNVIVLGGGMSNIGQIYEEVPSRWGRYIFSDACETVLVQAKHGDASGVRGAARLWSGG
jgi:fructokinase